MDILQRIQKGLQHSKVIRYRTYKKINCVGHRKMVDQIFFATMILGLVLGAFFILKPKTEKLAETPSVEQPEQMEEVVNSEAQEEVHQELGDEPVQQEEEDFITFSDLEEKVKAKEATIKTYTLNKGESFAKFLSRSVINKTRYADITEALSGLMDLKKIAPNTVLMVFLDKRTRFLGLAIPTSKKEVVAVIQQEDGALMPFSQKGEVEIRQERIKGKVERTFQGSAQKAGVPSVIISQITNALSGEFDFRGNMRRGDTFDIIYNKTVTPNGIELDIDKQLLFVGLQSGKKSVYRYLYRDKSGQSAFYNPRGQRGQQYMEKRPMKAIPRLSSPYGWRRHPVLMYKVFHSGVDLAAPKGVPIYAAADGVITQIGHKGAYGKYIRIKHAAPYETAYGHMNGFRQGLKRGSHVKRGEIIGYVGATGRVTGPHLHFEVWKNNKTVNPLENHTIGGRQLTGFELAQFQSAAESIHPDFQRHLFGKDPLVPPKKPKKL